MLEVRLAAVHPWFVHTDLQLAGPRNWRAAAAVVVLKESVQAVAVIVLGCVGSFDQGVYHSHQQDQDPRGENASTGNAGLHLKYEEHEDGHSCQDREENVEKQRISTYRYCR